LRVGTFDVKFVQILQHPQKKDPRSRMLSVHDKVVHDEGMYEAKESLLDITKRIEMPTNRDGVIGSEYGVGCIWFHDTAVFG